MPWYEYSTTPAGKRMPYSEVRLWHGSRSVRLVGLVDSGADSSLIDAQYAELLGLDRSTATTTVAIGAGGTGLVTLQWPGVPLEMQFGTERFPFRGVCIDFPTGGDGVNLLGRADFFERHIVQFWDAAEMLNIDLSPDFPSSATA